MSEFITPVNPATGADLEPVARTSIADIAATVAKAREVQPAWAALPFDERAAAFEQLVVRLRDSEVVEELAGLITDEMGKPLELSRVEVKTAAARIADFVTAARDACTDEVRSDGKVEVTVQWRPLGVVAVIAPWNYPVSTPNNLVASALLTGNTVVLKPSEITPRSGAVYHRVLSELLPDGVFGLIQGAGPEGAALVGGAVDMVGFTGSVGTGERIAQAAAGDLKHVVLEMGGKDPMIVLEGADLDAAAAHAAAMSVRNAGQICVAVERVFVQDSVVEPFTAKVKEAIEKLRVGDPRADDTDMGPMASARQRELVVAQLDDARAKGASFVVDGEVGGPGFFLSPSVVTGVADDMLLATEETFGPVVAISNFADTDEALRRANATEFGLGASVWGSPGPDLDGVADRVEAGMVGVNRGLSAAAGAPWVGWKRSGHGFSRGVEGMRQFMQPRTRSRNVG